MSNVINFLNYIVWNFGDTIGQLRVIHLVLFGVSGYFIPNVIKDLKDLFSSSSGL